MTVAVDARDGSPLAHLGDAGPADGHLWPSEEQRLLLVAALADGDRARAAWRGWRARVDVDEEFGWASLRLMPLVYRNLAALGVADPLMARLKGVYRRAWYETHLLLRRTHPAVAALREAKIEVLLLKGAPLVLEYYRHHALRPLSDVDVCVHRADVHRALAVLEALGWRPARPLTQDHVRFFHAVQCVHPDGGEIDLHWHVASETRSNDLDTAFWADTEPLEFEGVTVRQLAPTMLLLHIVVHGVRWNEETPIRWIPDALTVLGARGAAIDWERLLATARRGRLTYRLALGLDYLVRHFDAPVPAWVAEALARTRVSFPERLERSVILRDTDSLQAHLAGNQWSIITDLARQVHPLRRPFAFAATYPHYLRYRLGLDGRRELLPLVLRFAGRRLVGWGAAGSR